jgi:CheY-like chemotaxis protein
MCLLMGYDLIVESELGRGSTFRIVLGERAERGVRHPEDDEAVEDAVPPPPPPPPPVASLPAPTGGPPRAPSWADFKVLVIDDERDSRVLISHYLAEFGCQVLTAGNGAEGIALAREHAPDLVTLDLIMPEMTGWEVLKQMKADPALRQVPVVVVSVLASEGRGRLLGAVDLVTKPFEREDLLRVLWRNLGRRRGGRVLLMVSDDGLRDELQELVEGRGLEAVAPSESEPLDAIRRHQPDAAVVDLSLPDARGVATLLELRDDRLLTGLPVLVVTHDGLNAKEHEIVGELATVFASADSATHAFTRLLDAVFPLVPAKGAVE